MSGGSGFLFAQTAAEDMYIPPPDAQETTLSFCFNLKYLLTIIGNTALASATVLYILKGSQTMFVRSMRLHPSSKKRNDVEIVSRIPMLTLNEATYFHFDTEGYTEKIPMSLPKTAAALVMFQNLNVPNALFSMHKGAGKKNVVAFQSPRGDATYVETVYRFRGSHEDEDDEDGDEEEEKESKGKYKQLFAAEFPVARLKKLLPAGKDTIFYVHVEPVNSPNMLLCFQLTPGSWIAYLQAPNEDISENDSEKMDPYILEYFKDGTI
jgi:hypothetical protein